MKSTISTLTVVNATKSNVNDSKLAIKKLTSLIKTERKKLNSLKLPNKRELKKLLDVKTPGSESPKDRNWKPGMRLPKALTAVSAGVTLFTAPAWLPDFAQKHMGIDVVNASEKDVYDAPGTRMEKYQQLLREKNKLNWFERNIQGKGAKYDELLYFTKYGRTKSYTFGNDGRGTTPTTPTFLEGDAEWQGELTLAQQQDIKDKSVVIKLEVKKYRKAVDKFEKVFFRKGQPIVIGSGGGSGEVPANTSRTPLPSPGRRQGGSSVPGMRYSSSGGRLITDPGGADYGTTGGYGSRSSTRIHGAGGEMGHTGEDYAMPVGEPLAMIAPGVVYDVGMMGDANDPGGPNGTNSGYGNFVVVKLDDGMYVRMAHLDKVFVTEGERVGAGSAGSGRAKVIGESGDTGLSTGPHLHLDYARQYTKSSAAVDQTLNPKSFIEGGGLVIGEDVKSDGRVTVDPTLGNVPANPAGTIPTTARPQSPVVPQARRTAPRPIDPYSAAAGANRKSVVQEKMDALQEEIYEYDEQLEGVRRFMDATREGSDMKYRTQYGTLVRGKTGLWNEDKLFNKNGTQVKLKTAADKTLIERIERERQKRVNQLNRFKSNVSADSDYIWSLNPQEQALLESDLNAIEQWQEDVANGVETTAAPVLPSQSAASREVPRQYPSYNMPQSASVNNNTMLVQQPAQAPVNVFSQGPQGGGQSLGPQESVSVSSIMSGILLTQLSGS